MRVPFYEYLAKRRKLNAIPRNLFVPKSESEKETRVFDKQNASMDEESVNVDKNDASEPKSCSSRSKKQVPSAAAGRPTGCSSRTRHGQRVAAERIAEMEKVIKSIIDPALLSYQLTFDFLKGIYLQVKEKLYQDVEISDISVTNFMDKHFVDGLYSTGKVPTEVEIFLVDESDPIIQPLEKMLLYLITCTDGEQGLRMAEFKEEFYIFEHQEESLTVAFDSSVKIESPGTSASSDDSGVKGDGDSPSSVKSDVSIHQSPQCEKPFDLLDFIENDDMPLPDLNAYCRNQNSLQLAAESGENSSRNCTFVSERLITKEPKGNDDAEVKSPDLPEVIIRKSLRICRNKKNI